MKQRSMYSRNPRTRQPFPNLPSPRIAVGIHRLAYQKHCGGCDPVFSSCPVSSLGLSLCVWANNLSRQKRAWLVVGSSGGRGGEGCGLLARRTNMCTTTENRRLGRFHNRKQTDERPSLLPCSAASYTTVPQSLVPLFRRVNYR
jgi:hypothetical protein